MPSTWHTAKGDKRSAPHYISTSQRESATVLNCGTMLIRRLPSLREPITVRMDLWRQAVEKGMGSVGCHVLQASPDTDVEHCMANAGMVP